ncbi:MAG: hypothetical protein R3Y13_04605 [bacterium]
MEKNIELTERKKQEVIKVLTTEIKYKKRIKKTEDVHIYLENNIIYSTQLYRNSFDCDMTDFACGFYEILYKKILNDKGINNIINKEKYFSNKSFAGDTMNSFNTVAMLVSEYGNSKDTCTCESIWPQYLRKYKHSYHCLANFWLVPMVVGRTIYSLSKITPSKDYMDRFLLYVKENMSKYQESFPCYFSNLDFNQFVRLNYLEGSYVINNDVKKFSINNKNAEEIITSMNELILKRAICIANSDIANELWNYFDKIGVIND